MKEEDCIEEDPCSLENDKYACIKCNIPCSNVIIHDEDAIKRKITDSKKEVI